MDTNESKEQRDDPDSLEGKGSIIEASPRDGDQPPAPIITPDSSEEKKDKKPKKGKKFLQRFNIYLLGFILIMVIAVVIAVIAVTSSRKNNSSNTTVNSQALTQSALSQIAAGDTNVGSSGQVLNIQSNTVFGGQVLIRDNLDVAGSVQVGSSLNIPSLHVSGNSTLNGLSVGTLAVSGNSTIQGQLTVQGGLNINGSVAFNGSVSAQQLSVSSLVMNGDINLAHHVVTSGSLPGRTDGTALGSGGTTSINGSDTAGTLTINTGSNPPAGCFATITFAHAFGSTPHITITPVGSGAAGLGYYVNQSTTNFSVCTTTAAPGGTTFAFNYIVFD